MKEALSQGLGINRQFLGFVCGSNVVHKFPDPNYKL